MKKVCFLVFIILILSTPISFATESTFTEKEIQQLDTYSIKEIQDIGNSKYLKTKKVISSADCFNPEKEPIKTFFEVNGNDYAQLDLYPDGSHVSHGVRGGTSRSGTGCTNWTDREVWLNAFLDGQFRFKVSYSHINSNYDKITSVGNPYQTYGVINGTIQGPYRKNLENSSGPAYAYYKFSCFNMGYQLRLNVGSDRAYTSYDSYAPWI